MKSKKILLSPPYLSELDWNALSESRKKFLDFSSHELISNFENEIARLSGTKYAVALSSGTASLHLGMKSLGILPGDKILVPTMTFAASAFPISYLGAVPIFIDISAEDWGVDLDLLENYLKKNANRESLKAIIIVDLFGHTCDYDKLLRICQEFNLELIIDAAESLGTLYKSKPSTINGKFSILSFNSNKIITTLGGGAIVTNDPKIESAVRKAANQSREDVHWYEHKDIGYNYRMSPLAAALGSSQISRLIECVSARREIRNQYENRLSKIPGLTVKLDSEWEKSNAWLTILSLDSNIHPNARQTVLQKLKEHNIESRFVWKPLHTQPVYQYNEKILNGNAEKIYIESLCLPSSPAMNTGDIDEISNLIKESLTQ